MSFGFSITDFLKLVELAFKTWERCRQSTAHFRVIGAEVGRTHITLRHIHQSWRAEEDRGWSLFPDEKAQLKHFSGECESALAAVEKILEKHSRVQNSRRAKFKFLVNDLVDDFEAVREVLRHCTNNLTSFHLVLTQDLLLRRHNVSEEQMLRRHQEIAQVLDGLGRTFVLETNNSTGEPAASQVSRGDQSDRATVHQAANVELRQRGIDESAIDQNQPLVKEWLDTVVFPDEGEENPDEEFDDQDVVDSIGLLILRDETLVGTDDIERDLHLPGSEATRMTKILARLLDAVTDGFQSSDGSSADLLQTAFSALDWQNKGYVESSDLLIECQYLMKHVQCEVTSNTISTIIDREVEKKQMIFQHRQTNHVTRAILRDVIERLGDVVMDSAAQKEEADLLIRVRWTALRKVSSLLNSSKASSWTTTTQAYLMSQRESVDLDLTIAGIVSMCIDVEELMSDIRDAVLAPSGTHFPDSGEVDTILEDMEIITQLIKSLQDPVKHHYLTTLAALDEQINTYARMPTHLAPRLRDLQLTECIALRRDWWTRLLILLHLLGLLDGAAEDPFRTWSRLGITARVAQLRIRFEAPDVTILLATFVKQFEDHRLHIERFKDICQREDTAFLQALRASPRKSQFASVPKGGERVCLRQLRGPAARYAGVRIILNQVDLCQQQIDFPTGRSGTQTVAEIPESVNASLLLKPSSVLRFEFECLPRNLPRDKRVVIAHAACLKIAQGRKSGTALWEVPIYVEHGQDGQNDVIHVTFGPETVPPTGYSSVSQHRIPAGWRCMLVPFLDRRLSQRVCFMNTATNLPTSVMWRLQRSVNGSDHDLLDTSQLQLLTNRTDYGFMNDEDCRRTLRAYGKGDLSREDLEYWI